jgi:hypothetical protein
MQKQLSGRARNVPLALLVITLITFNLFEGLLYSSYALAMA